MRKHSLKLMYITWEDAHANPQWAPMSALFEIKSPVIARSVGFLVQEDETSIVLASSYDGSAMFGNWQVIPKGMVRKKRTLMTLDMG